MDTRSFGITRSLHAGARPSYQDRDAVGGRGTHPTRRPLTLQPGSMFTLADMTGLRVSELAARAGVPPSTVRFYERAGLLPAARRAANGYRLFDDSAVDDLALIGRVKGA